MSRAGIILIMVSLASICFRDYVLAAAAGTLLILSSMMDRGALVSVEKPVFSLGIYFLMVFILLPIATEKVRFALPAEQIKNPLFFLTLATAALISYLGGKGVSYLQQPYILLATVLGTLIGVLFLKGLPAGLIIAAGIASVMARLF